MNTMTSGGRVYTFSSVEGKVIGTPKKTKEQITSGGTVGIATQNNPAPIKITTSIITCDEFFLADTNNNQSAFQLRNVDLACMEGHELKVISVAEKGSKPDYVAVYNRTTKMAYFQPEIVRSLFRINKVQTLLIGAAIGLIVGYMIDGKYFAPFISFLGLWIAYGIWKNSGKKGMRNFVASFDPAKF